MVKLFRASILFWSTLVLASCNLFEDDLAAGECSAVDANTQLYEFLQEHYFWNKELTSNFSPANYPDLFSAMDALRVPQDRFSFVMTEEEYQSNYVTSTYFGYGFSHEYNDSQDGLLVRFVYDNGSAAENGLRRGDTITEIDGVSVATIINQVSNGLTTLNDVFGPNEEGHSIDVSFTKPNGEVVVTEFTKAEVTSNTVMANKVFGAEIEGQTKQVGYLVFNSFREISKQELNNVFDEFKQRQVEELILDLRYNSGGLISVANQLSTQMAGNNVANQVFLQYVFNEKQSDENRSVIFDLGEGVEQLNLDNVTVLTTNSSCSASELVINSLSPFVNVNIVGDNTCGKPVGMSPKEMCNHRVFAINFQTQNAVGFGDYFDGFSPDCAMNDEITGDWGTESDPLLAEGLHLLQTGSCSAMSLSTRIKAKQKTKSSKKHRLDELFIDKNRL